MKTLKFLGSTVLICLFVVACAKTKKEEQARIAGDDKGKVQTDGTPGADGTLFDVEKEGYKGPLVTLKKNDATASGPQNAGQIVIVDDDAKKLYERMKVTVKGDNTETNGTDKMKQGKDLACSEFTTRTSEVKYSCIVHLDYRTGKLLYGSQTVTMDENAKTNSSAYQGKTLSIFEGEDAKGFLSVDGADAKALFDTLKVEEKPTVADGWMASKNTEKLGKNLRCYKQAALKTAAATTYTCSLSIEVNDGTVKASDEPAPERKSKTTDPEAKPEDGAKPEDQPKPEGDTTTPPAEDGSAPAVK